MFRRLKWFENHFVVFCPAFAQLPCLATQFIFALLLFILLYCALLCPRTHSFCPTLVAFSLKLFVFIDQW